MTTTEAISALNQLESTINAYNYAMVLMSYDGETVAPKNSAAGRGSALGTLGGVYHQLMTAPQNREIVDTILADRANVEVPIARRAELMKEAIDELTLVPEKEYTAYQILLAESSAVWHEAKLKSDWPAFQPYLEKIVDYNRRLAARKDAAKPAYDVLLDTYEKGITTAALDPFFKTLRDDLTPVILAVKDKPEPDIAFSRLPYPIAQQRVFSDRIMEIMGINRDDCAIGEVEHPFTTNASKHDVRITTHYHEDSPLSSMFSVIHEGGHALYELGSGDELEGTCLSGGCSMSLHESQSRFYENIIGRSRAFMDTLHPLLTELFPEQLKGVSPEQLYAAVNFAKPSLIRTEADELTYSMHVMIRYELEKAMFSGALKPADVPGEWNAMYKKYLGIDVPDHRRGVLQDSHWSTGLMGYFPSYALGSAYGVQMLEAMQKDLDVWGTVAAGNLAPVTAWLREKIHRYGKLMTPVQALRNAIGTDFDPTRYTNYLAQKYGELYKL